MLRRIKPRFSLRLFLIAFTLLAILFGGATNFIYRIKDQVRRHKTAIKKLESLGVDVNEQGYSFDLLVQPTTYELFVQKWIDKDAYKRAGRAEVDKWNPYAGTPKALENFPGVYGLNSIKFKDLVLNDESCEQLGKLPELQSISVERFAIHSTAIGHLEKLQKLSRLEIGGSITNDTAERLANIPHLSTLEFDASRLGERGARALSALKELKSVTINDATRVRPETIAALLKCKKLTDMDLYFEAPNEALLEELKHADKITSLSISSYTHCERPSLPDKTHLQIENGKAFSKLASA